MEEKPSYQEEKISPELKDVCEMLSRYVEANKKKVCFVANFVAFKESQPNAVCSECGDECDHEVSDEASRVMAYGDKETLRLMINELRDAIEDCSDSNDFINL